MAFGMLLLFIRRLYAGLQTLPIDTESAKIDGASRLQQIWYVDTPSNAIITLLH